MTENRLSMLKIIPSMVLVFLAFGLDISPASIEMGQAAWAKGKEERRSYRLGKTVRPDSYRIFMEPDLENRQFSGEETIFLTVKKSVDRIVLNAKEIEIAEPELSRVGDSHGDWIKPEIELDKTNERVVLKLKKKIKSGKYELRLKFAGEINDKLVGFYYSSAKDSEGKPIAIASTQMEPTDARRVFPCFDEPEFKASFKISIAVDPGLTAISNAPVKFIKEDKRNNKNIYNFEESPRMSSYLVAMVVGPFEATDPVTVNGVKIRVWATRGKKEQGLYSRGVVAKLLPFFEDYFGVKYPEKKLDLIAIPDFGPGAMENLGAITFRETRLLVDDKTSSSAKQSVASVVAHEMAHMWFGDLVTMRWWDDLWLNEAFATWMSTKAVDFYEPEWKVWDDFVHDRAYSMNTDALSSTRPIYAPVHNPAEAEEMFDEITYEKGASVLRMLETYLGEEDYKKGIQAYIDEFKYSNASGKDLWKALGKASGKPVSAIMESWIETPGYPLLTVLERDSEKGRIKLAQNRFLLLGDKDGKTDSQRWQIPVRMRSLSKSNEIRVSLMKGRRSSLSTAGDTGPVLVNAGASGFYRVSYPGKEFQALSEHIEQLTARERYQFLSDSWAMVEAGKMPVTSYLELTAQYKKENDPTVVSLLIKQLYHLDRFIDNSSRDSYASFVRDRLASIHKTLGWESKKGESDRTQILRSHVLSALGTLGQDKEVIEGARLRFQTYVSNPGGLNPNLYGAIVSIVAYNGDARDYETLMQLWKRSQSAEAKVRNLLALAVFRNPSLQGRTLKLSLTDDVKTQDAPHLVKNLLSTTAGRERGWQFVKKNWQTMEKRFPVHLFPRVIKGTTALVTQRDVEDLSAFLSSHPIRSGSRVAAKVLERVKLNARVNKKSSKELQEWLKSAAK